MGTRGPKPLPANVHRLQGNRSKIPESKLSDSVLPEISIPKVPSHLHVIAKKEWRRISELLKEVGLIAEMDMAALAVYCQAYSRWVVAEKKLKDLGDDALVDSTPKGHQQMCAWLIISNRAVEQMHKFMAEFGMSPSSRSRVTASPQLELFGDDQGKPKTNYF